MAPDLMFKVSAGGLRSSHAWTSGVVCGQVVQYDVDFLAGMRLDGLLRRFTDFQSHLNISRAVLTQRLTALVEAGLVDRSPRGGREEYVLTERGIALWPALYALTRWGEAQSARGPRRVFAHVACGTDLDVTGCCPSCGVSPPPGDLQMRPGPGFNAEGRDNPVSAALAHPHRLLEPLLPATGPRWAHRRGGGAYA
jgi:DNA-binding MarR family transcriptional regulator